MDLLKSTYPVCPLCAGAGKRLFSVTVKGSSTNSDWAMNRFYAHALGNWEKIDVEMRELIDKKVKAGRFKSGQKEYMTCPRCHGSGRLVPHIEAAWQRNERLAQAFFRSRGWL